MNADQAPPSTLWKRNALVLESQALSSVLRPREARARGGGAWTAGWESKEPPTAPPSGPTMLVQSWSRTPASLPSRDVVMNSESIRTSVTGSELCREGAEGLEWLSSPLSWDL
jgi:hypothetical protein